MGKLFTAGLFILLLFFFETTRSCLGGISTLGCIEAERQALLKFKHSLTDPSHRLSSWKTKDCCKWKGVTCNGTTGHVVKLDIRNVDTGLISSSGDLSSPYYLEAPEVNSSLLELKYLNYLDLSGNDFQVSQVPKFFVSMKRLTYLNLSAANFGGNIPHHLGNLSSLRVLDLSSNDLVISTADDLMWLSRLSSLQKLGLSNLDLSQARNLVKVLNMLPSIIELSMSNCQLDSTHLSHASLNSTLSNVQYLDLSYNSIDGKFPDLLRNMTSLRVLDLTTNSFNSSIPLFVENFKSLIYLGLSSNQFSDIEGGLSTVLSNKCRLKLLDLTGNTIQGEIVRIAGNLSGCIEYDLETLLLTGNKFRGNLPDWLGQLKRLRRLGLGTNSFNGSIPASLGRLSALRELDLSENQLTGPIPASVGKLALLTFLDLSNNQLNGTLPIPLGQLSKLDTLQISSNSLEGVVSEAHFANLSMLQHMDIGSNLLTVKVRSEWIPPFQAKYIAMGSCKIGGEFPQWVRTQEEVVTLLLSNASISGTLPEWLRDMHISELNLFHNNISGSISNLPSAITIADLSDNSISGPLPHNISDMIPNAEYLLLADNLLNGSIPNALCKIRTLRGLDFSGNRLSGNLPHCWKDFLELNVLRLSSNRLSGVIPSSLGDISSLQWLHLNNNSFYGELPLALRNCTSLIVLDVGENGLSGKVPKWIGEKLLDLRILRLHKNNFSGRIPSELCYLSGLKIMDLGENNLTGTIPRCFSNFSSMVVEESTVDLFFHEQWSEENMMVSMKGVELEYTRTLVLVVNMDLSSNELVGTIPEELTVLVGLFGLNLSHNHLTGSIPNKIGDMKSLISLDFSNNNISGNIPQSMAALTSISHLNLSYNKLSGQIPTGPQLQTHDDPSIYVGNSELCGFPLPKKCDGDESPQAPTTPTSHEEKDEAEKVWFYIDIMSGFATGFWGVIGVLVFKKRWRHAFFRFVEVTQERIVVAIGEGMASLKMKRNHRDG